MSTSKRWLLTSMHENRSTVDGDSVLRLPILQIKQQPSGGSQGQHSCGIAITRTRTLVTPNRNTFEYQVWCFLFGKNKNKYKV